MSKKRTAIIPTRKQDYPKWYQEVIKAADLAENSVVRGCMVIKPWGYGIWENIKNYLDDGIKKTGHQNLYFPMFIPLSMIEGEAEHVEGFAKECAVVTHHRLSATSSGLKADGELEEPLVIRPTSEAVIGDAYAKWINSYRDLPLLYNQWANVVRWELRPRLFLRTSEFLWQEGHTAHATSSEAISEALKMLMEYKKLLEEFLAIPVIVGRKTEREKFPGADVTYTLEVMTQDKKALQAGTSHFLGQKFAKAFNIKYLSREGKEEYVWTTSWGVSTRLMGGIIMVHSDDNGLVLPPRVSPLKLVIVPAIHREEERDTILDYCNNFVLELENKYPDYDIKIDLTEKSTGNKVWGWVKKGVPIVVEIGEREVKDDLVFVLRRDKEVKEMQGKDIFLREFNNILKEMQNTFFERAKVYRKRNLIFVDSKEKFFQNVSGKEEGFILCYWADDEETEKMLKKKFNITPRCIPIDNDDLPSGVDVTKRGRCIFTGEENAPLVLFAKAY